MKFTPAEVLQYVQEEDIKFVRLAFCDVFGRQKNIAVMSGELKRAFESGIAIDASAIPGFGGEIRSDLLLRPDPATLAQLPWRPESGRVVRMFCDVTHPDGSVLGTDARNLLKNAVREAQQAGITLAFGAEMEFYLFKTDENGAPTRYPYDNAGYMDIAPDDKGENVRREVCLTLERMGIKPESSHHEEGPGQNEIDFRYSDPLTAADNAITFKSVVNTIAARNGLKADFSPKPLESMPGNGMHINISAKAKDGRDVMPQVISGILEHICEITAFLNTTSDSYKRFGNNKAPKYVSWSSENRSQLVRIPAADGEYKRAELRSPDPMCNPYLAFALLIWAGLDGIKKGLELPEMADINLFNAPEEETKKYKTLPGDLFSAGKAAKESDFVNTHLPRSITENYCK